MFPSFDLPGNPLQVGKVAKKPMGISRKGLLATRDLASSDYQQMLALATSVNCNPSSSTSVPSRGKGTTAAQDYASLFQRVYKK